MHINIKNIKNYCQKFKIGTHKPFCGHLCLCDIQVNKFFVYTTHTILPSVPLNSYKTEYISIRTITTNNHRL